jgi:hypothetical protein
MAFMEEEPSGERKLLEQDETRGGAQQKGGIIWSQFPPDPMGHNGV